MLIKTKMPKRFYLKGSTKLAVGQHYPEEYSMRLEASTWMVRWHDFRRYCNDIRPTISSLTGDLEKFYSAFDKFCAENVCIKCFQRTWTKVFLFYVLKFKILFWAKSLRLVTLIEDVLSYC